MTMMQTNRVRGPGRVAIAIASAALVAGSCQLSEDGPAGRAVEYDGETLLRGILLGEGEIAGLIPEIRDSYALDQQGLSKDDLATVLAANDAIVAWIRSARPEFLDAFAAAMHSGDHVRIRRGLDDGGALALAAVDAIGLTRDLDLSDDHKCCLIAFCHVATTGPTFIVVLIENQLATSSPEGRLARERIVDSIALRLAL